MKTSLGEVALLCALPLAHSSTIAVSASGSRDRFARPSHGAFTDALSRPDDVATALALPTMARLRHRSSAARLG